MPLPCPVQQTAVMLSGATPLVARTARTVPAAASHICDASRSVKAGRGWSAWSARPATASSRPRSSNRAAFATVPPTSMPR